ncbi:hypothetical protein SAMD00019534_104680 [Acytostelium subglobosum LB1]|uniref:hypothetical protein n=1 Tax=Acytostelium subglobosum LB1 TaxID=1410327 RepID=UPI000644B24A|nr:hypothetical protein SAMD00019534_104680 [Acytostelium subglobosum LB1]GAM27293.1 hypothetical protein SAMD00019534_104680 [Acytostelium subglobosum LB1]|eukprot:XP_012749760.1 hypothetical protein SAMD00019534_104680 [Acytostelium subglobosum LB1]
MGQAFARLFTRITHSRDLKVLIIGLDGAGKTSIISRLRLGEVITSNPIEGFRVEQVQYNNIRFICWDICGDRIRPLWRQYYENVQGIIFVIDSNDRVRMPEACLELHKLAKEDELRDSPILIWCNKQNLPNAMLIGEITECLDQAILGAFNRRWHIQDCCSLTGDGLYEGLEWLANTVMN